jgi:hypothetical protein
MPLVWPLLSAALAASPAAAAPVTTTRPISIQRLAHYCNWHLKCATDAACDSWRYAATLPRLRDAQPGVGYASDDPRIIRAHNRDLWANGITPLVSWWGPSAPAGGDAFLDAYLREWDARAPVRAGLLYEVTARLKMVNGLVDFTDTENAERFVADVRYLSERYWARQPERFYRIDGRPVLFIWLSHAFRGPFDEVVARVRREVPVYIIGSDFNMPADFRPGLESVARGLDAVSAYGIYTPALATRHQAQITEADVEEYAGSAREWSRWLAEHAAGTALILPLQFAFDDHLVMPPRDHPPLSSTPAIVARLAETAQGLIAGSQAGCGNILPFVLFVSYNEHFEGTAAEANDRYGDSWLETLRRTFAAPVLRPTECRPAGR